MSNSDSQILSCRYTRDERNLYLQADRAGLIRTEHRVNKSDLSSSAFGRIEELKKDVQQALNFLVSHPLNSIPKWIVDQPDLGPSLSLRLDRLSSLLNQIPIELDPSLNADGEYRRTVFFDEQARKRIIQEKILINPRLLRPEAVKTVLHELMHVAQEHVTDFFVQSRSATDSYYTEIEAWIISHLIAIQAGFKTDIMERTLNSFLFSEDARECLKTQTLWNNCQKPKYKNSSECLREDRLQEEFSRGKIFLNSEPDESNDTEFPLRLFRNFENSLRIYTARISLF